LVVVLAVITQLPLAFLVVLVVAQVLIQEQLQEALQHRVKVMQVGIPFITAAMTNAFAEVEVAQERLEQLGQVRNQVMVVLVYK
jgi:hypothetical protein